MEASIADPAVAGEEPVAPVQPDPPAPVEPLPEAEPAPEVTPGQITLSTGQTESVADIAVVDAHFHGLTPGGSVISETPEWIELATASGAPFKVRASEIVRYQ